MRSKILFRYKSNRKGIDTMPGIFGGHSFSIKYVSEVAIAVGTNNLHPFHAERVVGMARNRPRYFIVERRPTAAAVKFVGAVIQRGITAPTNKLAFGFEIIVLARESALGAFILHHSSLF